MECFEHEDRASKGLVIAWRGWQVGLAVIGALACIALTGGDPQTGSATVRRVATHDPEAPVCSLAFAGSTTLASSTTTGEVRLNDLATGRILRLQGGPGDLRPLPGDPPGRPDPGRRGDLARRPLLGHGDRHRVGAVENRRGVGQDHRVLVRRFDARDRHVAAGRAARRRGYDLGVAQTPPNGGPGGSPQGYQRPGLLARRLEARLRRFGGRSESLGPDQPQPLASWRAHEGGINAVAFSPDGGLFATASYVGGVVRLWGGAGGEPRGELSSAPPA